MMLSKKTGKSGSLLAAVAAATLALSACGSGGPAEPKGATAWALTGQEKTVQAAFDSWNAGTQDQQIKLEFFENDAYKQKIRTAIGSGDSPTMIWTWGGQGTLKDYVDSGKVVPLDESLTEGFFPSIADNGRVNGELYAIPNNSVQPVVLYYNKDLFEQAGIDAPAATWKELLEDVATLKSKGIAPFSMGGASKWPQLMWLEYLVDRIGGPEVFNAIQQNQPGAWSDPAVLQSIDMIQELVDAGAFIEGYESIATDSSADTALVYTGKAAMILQGAWAYADIKTAAPDFIAADKLGWADFPAVEGGTGKADSLVGNASNYWSISSDSSKEAQASAAAFLVKTNMDEQYMDGLLAGGGVPPVEGIEDKISAVENSEFLMDIYTMARDASSFTLSWDQAIAPAAASEMLTNLDKAFLGQIDAQQFADAMNKTIK